MGRNLGTNFSPDGDYNPALTNESPECILMGVIRSDEFNPNP